MNSKNKKKVMTDGDTTFYRFDSKMGFWGENYIERNVRFDQRPDQLIKVIHNSEGNRDREIVLDGDEKTIVCMGGSHTWGAAVDQNSRYTNFLEEKSNTKVLNIGHCSLGLDQVCLAILLKTIKYRPKIIIVEQYPWAVHRVLNNFVNGYVRPHFYIDAKDELQLRKLPSIIKIPLFRKIVGNYYSFKKEFVEYKAGINLEGKPGSFVDPIFACWKTRHYDYMYGLIDRILVVIRDHCHQNGIKLLFGLGTIKQQFGPSSSSNLVDYDLPRRRLIKLLEKNQINFVDTTENMLAENTKVSPVIFEDGHINEKGHALFSEILYKELIKLGWVD